MNAAAEIGVDKKTDQTDMQSVESRVDTALREVRRHNFFQDTDDTLVPLTDEDADDELPDLPDEGADSLFDELDADEDEGEFADE